MASRSSEVNFTKNYTLLYIFLYIHMRQLDRDKAFFRMLLICLLVFSARKSEHITPLLRELHWLRVPKRIQFRLCVLVHHCLNGIAPSYLAETLQKSADVGARQRLRSAATSTLVVPPTRRAKRGDRAFPVAAARAWNALPLSVRAVSSLLLFRRELKTTLFRASYA